MDIEVPQVVYKLDAKVYHGTMSVPDALEQAFSAGMRAGEIAMREFVIDLLDKRMRKMLEVDAEDGPEGVEIAKAECFHLMEIQRILRGQTTCGVYDDYGKVPAAPEETKP